jgi:hypothetical protein
VLAFSVLAPIIAFGVAGTIADSLGPTLILSHPLVEVGLTPKIRYLTLAAGRILAPMWYALGVCEARNRRPLLVPARTVVRG